MESFRGLHELRKVEPIRPSTEKRHRLTFGEDILVQHAYPPKLILDSVGFMWAVYMVWNHALVSGMVTLCFFAGVGSLTTAGINKAALKGTALGRYCLMAKNPVTLFSLIAGYVILFYGVWNHSTIYILGAITCMAFGRLWGWDKFMKRWIPNF